MSKEINLSTESLSSPETLPNIDYIILKSGLYKEFHLQGDFTYVKRILNGPDIQFDEYCCYCNSFSTFKYNSGPRGSGSGSNPNKDDYWLQDRVFFLDFICQRRANHKYYYVFRVEKQSICKIGQSPSLASIISTNNNKFKSVIDKNYVRDLNTAIGLFSHGVGAGSFVYLRRVFEFILKETCETARESGDAIENFEKMRTDEKIKALNAYLPDEIVQTSGTYSILSAGIHTLSDEDCLSIFPVMRASIELILDGYVASREREKHRLEILKAINNINRDVSNS